MITSASPTASTTPSAMMQRPPPPPPPPPAPPHSAIRSSSSGSDSSGRSGRGRLNPRASLDSDTGHGTTFKSISAPSTPRLQPAETSYEDIRIHFPRLQRAHNPPGAASAPSSRPVSTVPSLALVQQTLGGLLTGGSSSNTQQPLNPTAPGSNLTVATAAAAESRRTSGWSDSASPTGSVSAGATTNGWLAAARARILRVVGSHRLFELLALTDAVTALSLALWAWTALEPAQAAIGALDMVTVALARTICLALVGRGYVTAATPASVCLTSLVYALGKTVALASVPGALDGPATAPFLMHAIVAPVLEWTVSATAHATDAVAHWPAALRRASRSALAETGDLTTAPAPAPPARLTSGRGTTRGKSGRGKRTPSSKRPLLASDEFNSLEYRTFLGAAGPSNAPAAPPSDDDQPARRARSFTFSGKPTSGAGTAPDTPWLATSPPPAVPRPRPRPANRPPPNKNPNRWSVAVFDAAHLPHLDVGPFPVPPLPVTLAPPPPGPFSSSPVATTASGLSARGVSPTPSLPPQPPRTPPALAPAVAPPSSVPGGLAAQSVSSSTLNNSGSLGTSVVPAAAVAAAWALLPPPATSSTPTAVPPMSAVPAHVRRAVGGGHAAGDDADDEDEVDLTARLFSSRSVMGSSYGATSTGTVLSPSEGESESEDGFETGTTDDDEEESNEPSSKSLTPRSGSVAHAHAASGVQAPAAGALGARPTLSDDTSATETEEESYDDDEDEDDDDDDDDDDANSVLLHVPRPWVHELGSASDRSPSRSPSRRARSRSAHRQRSRSARSRSARRRPTAEATAAEPAAPETSLAETPVSRPLRPVSSRIICTPASEDDTDADADEHRDTRPRARKFLTPATAESPRRTLRRAARTIASPATDTLPHAAVAFETPRRSWSSDDDEDDDDETVAAAAMSPPPRRVRLNVDVDGVAVVPLALDRDGVDMLGDPVQDGMADSGVVFATPAIGSTVDA